MEIIPTKSICHPRQLLSRARYFNDIQFLVPSCDAHHSTSLSTNVKCLDPHLYPMLPRDQHQMNCQEFPIQFGHIRRISEQGQNSPAHIDSKS